MSTMQDWNQYRDALLKRVSGFARLNPGVMRGFQAMDAGNAAGGALSPKMHELIALAVAVTTRCDGCIAIHGQKAVEHGASEAEIAEALGVAISLNAGAALTYSARVFDSLATLPDGRSDNPAG